MRIKFAKLIAGLGVGLTSYYFDGVVLRTYLDPRRSRLRVLGRGLGD